MAKSSLKTREKFAALGFVAPLFIGFAPQFIHRSKALVIVSIRK